MTRDELIEEAAAALRASSQAPLEVPYDRLAGDGKEFWRRYARAVIPLVARAVLERAAGRIDETCARRAEEAGWRPSSPASRELAAAAQSLHWAAQSVRALLAEYTPEAPIPLKETP